MKKFRTSDDVTRDREEREREKFKKNVVEDINEVFGELFPRKEKKEKKFSPIKWFFIILAFLILTTLVLGCIFLIKLFIDNIF